MTLSPERGEILKSRALELSPSRHRRPYYYERYGSPDDSATNLKDSTMAGISNLKAEVQNHQKETNSGLLKSELIGDVFTHNLKEEPGSAMLRSQYHGNTKYNETFIEQEEALEDDSIESHKARLFTNIDSCLSDILNIEQKRKNLSMRYDFNLTEIFNMIDVEKTGYIGLNDLDEWAIQSKVNMTREDWAMMLDRFDKSKDSKFCFTEFSSLFLPWAEVYRRTMVGRSMTQVQNFQQYTVQTRKLLKDL